MSDSILIDYMSTQYLCTTLSLSGHQINFAKDAIRLIIAVFLAPVSCGNHMASTCADCPQGNGASWCNGDCHWFDGQCEGKKDMKMHLCKPTDRKAFTAVT